MLDDFKSAFRESAGEFLLEMEDALLQLNKNPDDISEVDRLFRVMHTIKGTAAMVNLDDIAKFAHTLESECDFLRQGQAKVTPEIVHLALCAHDCFTTLIESHYGGEPADAELLSSVLQKFADARKAATVNDTNQNYSPERINALLVAILGDLEKTRKTGDRVGLLYSIGKQITQLYFLLLIQNKESIAEFLAQIELLYRQARIEKLDLNVELVDMSVEIVAEASTMFNEVDCCLEADFDPFKILLAMERPLALNAKLQALIGSQTRQNPLPVLIRTLHIHVVADERGPGSMVGLDRFEKIFKHLGEQIFMQAHKKEAESAI